MGTLLLYKNYLAKDAGTEADCSLFKVDIGTGRTSRKKENKDSYLCGKRGSTAVFAAALQKCLLSERDQVSVLIDRFSKIWRKQVVLIKQLLSVFDFSFTLEEASWNSRVRLMVKSDPKWEITHLKFNAKLHHSKFIWPVEQNTALRTSSDFLQMQRRQFCIGLHAPHPWKVSCPAKRALSSA